MNTLKQVHAEALLRAAVIENHKHETDAAPPGGDFEFSDAHIHRLTKLSAREDRKRVLYKTQRFALRFMAAACILFAMFSGAMLTSTGVRAAVADTIRDLGRRAKSIVASEGGVIIMTDQFDDEDLNAVVALPNAGDEWEQTRREFIMSLNKIQVMKDGRELDASITPFEVELTNTFDRFMCTFYQVEADGAYFAVPMELGNGSFSYLASPDGTRTFAVTDSTIWEIDARNKTAAQTADQKYGGKTIGEWRDIIRDNGGGSDGGPWLYWIGNPVMGSGGGYILYRSNRDCILSGLVGDSLWKHDLKTGKDELLLSGADGSYHVIEGFVGDSRVLMQRITGNVRQYFIYDITDGTVTPITFPELPNFRITGTSDQGYAAFSSFVDHPETVVLFRLDGGAVTKLIELDGYFANGVEFSPDGKRAAILYGTEPDKGVNDIYLFDLENKTARLLSSTVTLDGTADSFDWLDNNELLVVTRKVIDGNVEKYSQIVTLG